jgi:hypothetical protein
MTRGDILKILQDDVSIATKEFREASDRFIEVFRDSQEQSSEPSSVDLAYKASAEKARARERLDLALQRLHKFETTGTVPLNLEKPKSEH